MNWIPRPLNEEQQGAVVRIKCILIVLLGIKFLGFATLSESAGMAKVIKTVLGLLTTGSMMLTVMYAARKGFLGRMRFSEPFPVYGYMLYLLLGIFSLLWTSDISVSMLQLVRIIELFVFSVLAILLQHRIQFQIPNQDFSWSSLLVWPLVANISYFLIGFFSDPEKFMRKTHGGEVERLGGQIMNPNELGMLSAVTAIILLLELYKGKQKLLYGVSLLACLYVLYLTGSRSSLIGFALALLVYIFYQKNRLLKIATPVAMVLAAPIAFQVVFMKEGAGDMEEVMSMTGRLPFWKALLTEGLPREPMLGYGFMRINYTTYFQGANTYPASMTHNTFIQVIMNLGFAGFFIALMQMAAFTNALIRHRLHGNQIMIALLMIPILINSFTEFGIWGEVNYSILLYQLVTVIVSSSFDNRFSKTEWTKMDKNFPLSLPIKEKVSHSGKKNQS
ncbi:MAG: O-antigen ligase family protein [Cytophagaceae bacterium]|nr:O-antigen ligase family protein [Cytophagaceae bacterium]